MLVGLCPQFKQLPRRHFSMTSTIIVYKCSRQNASHWFLVTLSFSSEKSPIDISNEDFLLPFQMFVNAYIQYNIRIKRHLTFKWCFKDARTRYMELQIKIYWISEDGIAMLWLYLVQKSIYQFVTYQNWLKKCCFIHTRRNVQRKCFEIKITSMYAFSNSWKNQSFRYSFSDPQDIIFDFFEHFIRS